MRMCAVWKTSSQFAKREYHRQNAAAHESCSPTTGSMPTDNLHWKLINKRKEGVLRQHQLKSFMASSFYSPEVVFALQSRAKLCFHSLKLLVCMSLIFGKMSAIPFVQHNVSSKDSRRLVQFKNFVCIKDVGICQSQPNNSNVLLLSFLKGTERFQLCSDIWTPSLQRNFWTTLFRT